MKKVLSPMLALLFVLSSVGIHLDLTFCCGSLERIGLSHQVETNLVSCCDDHAKTCCTSETEIIQAPIYQDVLLEKETSVKIPCFDVQTFNFNESPAKFSSLALKCLQKQKPKPDQSLLQVFLC